MLITMNSVLYWGLGFVITYLVLQFVYDVRMHLNIFKRMKAGSDEFLIEYSDCPDWASMVALYIINNKG